MPLDGKLRTCIDPASFEDPILDGMERRIVDCGLQLRLFDMTSDVAIPCYTATLAGTGILTARQPRYHDVTIGHGAHPVAGRAAIRAVTEAAQSRLTYISGARDDVFPETFTRPLPSETQRLFEAVPQRKTAAATNAGRGPQELLRFVMRRLEEARIGSTIVVPLVEEGQCRFLSSRFSFPTSKTPMSFASAASERGR